MRGPHRIGHGVVDVAHLGGPIAVGKPARQIAAAHDIGQCGRGPIARFGRPVLGKNERPNLGPAGHVLHRFGGQCAVTGQKARLGALALERARLGQHMNDDLVGGAVCSGCGAAV